MLIKKRKHSSLLIILSVILLSASLGCEGKTGKLFHKGEELWLKGSYKEAAEIYAQIIYEYPKSPFRDEALFRLGETHYLFFKDPKKAIGYFRELVQQYPKSKLAHKAQNYTASIYYHSLEDYNLSIMEYKKLIGNFSNKGMADKHQLAIADIYFKKGD